MSSRDSWCINRDRPAAMIADSRRFVGDLAVRYGQRVRSFLATRVRNSADVGDLAQEVFLRLLRVARHEHIRNPEAYLITIASHVLHQQALKDALIPSHTELSEALADARFAISADPVAEIHLERRLECLDRALKKVPPRSRVAFILQRRDGCTLDEIAGRMGISRSMVKKHLARAILQCARHIEARE